MMMGGVKVENDEGEWARREGDARDWPRDGIYITGMQIPSELDTIFRIIEASSTLPITSILRHPPSLGLLLARGKRGKT